MLPVLQQSIANAFKVLYGFDINPEEIKLTPTRKEFEGSHTLTVFQYTKTTARTPEQLGNQLGNYLVTHIPIVSGFQVVKGFLNISLSHSFWISVLNNILAASDYGRKPTNGKTVMVEYSSPNTNKPLHLGHLRNNFLGYSLSQILEFDGYRVIKANLINDRGIHICKSMLAYQKYGEGETPDSSGLKGDHLVGKYYVLFDKRLKEEAEKLRLSGWTEEDIERKNPLLVEAQEMLRKWESGDEAVVNLWKKMNGWVYTGFAETYKAIGVSFDRYYYESETYLLGKEVVEEGLEQGVFYRKEDGSVWIDLTDEGLDHKLVLRSDGTSVYITQDLGTADLKYRDFGLDSSVYVVGNEQDYHFIVLKHILSRLKRPYAAGLYHLSYGMVDLPSGKMKSREGTVVDADDLIKEMKETAAETTQQLGKIEGFEESELEDLYRKLGMGALKYFLLKVDPKKRMLFDPKESIQFQGNTGPFIQYTYARISAILRKATQSGLETSQYRAPEMYPLTEPEREVIRLLYAYEEKSEEAAQTYSPSVVANYVYELAKEYNRFYTELSIFNDPDTSVVAFRVALSYSVAKVIESGTMLLGIEVPERM